MSQTKGEEQLFSPHLLIRLIGLSIRIVLGFIINYYSYGLRRKKFGPCNHLRVLTHNHTHYMAYSWSSPQIL